MDIGQCIINRPTWEELFFTDAIMWSLRSIDPSTQVGCVITTKDNVPLSYGYNGPIRGSDLSNKDLLKALETRPDKYMYMEHGERNAIYNALRTGKTVEGAVLYINGLPCTDCCRAICQSGISCVRILKETNDLWAKHPQWESGYKAAYDMFKVANVKVEIMDVAILFPISVRLNGTYHDIGLKGKYN